MVASCQAPAVLSWTMSFTAKGCVRTLPTLSAPLRSNRHRMAMRRRLSRRRGCPPKGGQPKSCRRRSVLSVDPYRRRPPRQCRATCPGAGVPRLVMPGLHNCAQKQRSTAQVEDSLLPAEQKDSMYSSPSLTRIAAVRSVAAASRGRAAARAAVRSRCATPRDSSRTGSRRSSARARR